MNFAMIPKNLSALRVIVTINLKQQTTSSWVTRFFPENGQEFLKDLFKTDGSLKNLNDEMLLDTFIWFRHM